MSYTVENVNGCTKKLVFKFDQLDLTDQIKDALAKKQKESSLKGFRKGKAPLSVIKQIYGQQVETDALNQFVQMELYNAIQKEELRVVGYPSFENMNYESMKTVSFDALVEVFPTIELKDTKGYTFTKDKVEVTDTDVEEVRKSHLEAKAEMKVIEDDKVTLDKGMFAVLNFQGEMEDGTKPENMKGEEFLLEIGSGQFIPGFEEGMTGMKKGEKKDLELTFPADYQMSDLQNAKVKFAVELLEIKEKNYPEFTDEVAKEMKFESVADFEEKTKERILAQKERQSKEKLHQEVLEKLIEENSFDIPNALLDQQVKYLKDDMKRNFSYQGMNDEMFEQYYTKWEDDFKKKADFQVRSGLILDHLGKEYKVEATDEDFNNKLEETAAQSGMELDKIKEYYTTNEQVKQNLMYGIREEKTFEKLLESVTVK